jgi:hypothetical protein
MSLRKLRTIVGVMCWLLAFCVAGCRTAQQPSAAEAKKVAEDAAVAAARDEARDVAEASLGKLAEVLAHGDLAQNGREQVLVVNRMSAAAEGGASTTHSPAMLIRRAAVLEKEGGKWSQVLLCDEYLKNPNGYLGRSPSGRVSGWRLEYRQDAQQGLQMKFTPAGIFDAMDVQTGEHFERRSPTFDVRWNKSAKRYQSFDQSHERYLSEVPSIGIPQSILK